MAKSKKSAAKTVKKTASKGGERTLIISEKDIAAKRIASILSDGRVSQDKVKGVNVYEWDDTVVIGLRGHIISLDYPKEHKRWSLKRIDELVWAQPEKQVDRDARNIVDALKVLAKQSNTVVLATDFDREGELIGVEGLDFVKEVTPDITVKRARFSALTPGEVRRAFDELAEVDHNLAASAEARQEVDLAWGAALTRFISLSSGQRGDDFLSVGRVQSPTLALIVDKEKEIRAFTPTPYWEVHATLVDGTGFDAQHKNGRFWNESDAQQAHARIAQADSGTVVEVNRTERTEKAPDPFNTTSFLRAATAIGLTAARAMSVAEDLYTNGYISYPRTDNTVYPPSLELKPILEKLASPKSAFRKEAQGVLDRWPVTPTKGKKTSTDHPPIHPTEVAPATELTGQQWKVYELVVRRFLATLCPPAKTESLRVTVDVSGEPLVANGHRLLEPGFRAVYSYHRGGDVILPQMEEGDTLAVRDARMLSKETQPPKRYSQGKLIQEMENRGLGTKSTRADIIDKLYKRDYVRNNPPEPTETGFAVIDALERYVDLMTKPEMTARLEAEMDEIAEGQRALEGVVEDSRKMLEQIIRELEENREQVGNEIRKALQAKNTVGKCKACANNLLIRRARTGKRFIGCLGWPDCTNTFPLPQFGKIVAEERECHVCNAPVIRVIQAKKRPWVTCLTLDCRGIEDLQREEAEKRKAEKAAQAEEEAEEGEIPVEEIDPEDLGEEAEEEAQTA